MILTCNKLDDMTDGLMLDDRWIDT